MPRIRQFLLAVIDGAAAGVAGVRSWSRLRTVAVTCVGPFLGVLLSALNHPFLGVLSFLAGVVFFHAANPAPRPPSPPTDDAPPSDLEA